MYLNKNQEKKTRQIISRLLSKPVNPQVLVTLFDEIAPLLHAHYCALLLLPLAKTPSPGLFSNDTPDFIHLYQQLQSQDFLRQHLLETGERTVFADLVHRKPELLQTPFCRAMQNLRPVSDVAIEPLRIRGRIRGFTGIARARLKNEPFSKNELNLFGYLTRFVEEGFYRTLYISDAGDSRTATVNAYGEILSAGDEITKVFHELFTEPFHRRPSAGKNRNAALFRKSLDQYSSPAPAPDSARLILSDNGKRFLFLLKKTPPESFRAYFPETAQITITLYSPEETGSAETECSALLMAELYGLTAREREIITCLYRGYSNAEISRTLQIGLNTVKHHLWNIYNKCGVYSRTQLLSELIHQR